MMHSFREGQVSEARIISSGDNWFVNWADIPSIVALDKKGNNLMAHWLQMSAEGTYDYDIRCSISTDGGDSWGDSFVLHDDGISAEHGFVTMVSDDNGAFATWLDGRNTKTPTLSKNKDVVNDHNHDHGHQANLPMTLRAARIDSKGMKTDDMEIDNRVCDCCQTDAVITPSGPVVVYRDRTNDEVRDISVARYVNKKWEVKPLHKDNWRIAGCPVNGPAIAYERGLLAVAWYTQMNDLPKIFLSVSEDDGKTFKSPILIAEKGVLGRVDVVIVNQEIIVTWMESENEDAHISSRIYTYPTQLITEGHNLIVTSKERRSGFPIIEHVAGELLMVRTVVKDDQTSINLERFDGP